jgi:hypothetical protein
MYIVYNCFFLSNLRKKFYIMPDAPMDAIKRITMFDLEHKRKKLQVQGEEGSKYTGQ